jgi:hypothetical protein
VEDALLVRAVEEQESYVDEALRRAPPAHPVHAPLALLHPGGVPLEIIVDDVPALLDDQVPLRVIEQRLARLVMVGGVVKVAVDHCANRPNREGASPRQREGVGRE